MPFLCLNNRSKDRTSLFICRSSNVGFALSTSTLKFIFTKSYFRLESFLITQLLNIICIRNSPIEEVKIHNHRHHRNIKCFLTLIYKILKSEEKAKFFYKILESNSRIQSHTNIQSSIPF